VLERGRSGIEWLFGPPPGGVPPDPAEWLSGIELERLARFRFEKRRSEWLVGRFTAKSLVASALVRRGERPRDLRSIEIVPEPSGAPFVRDVASGTRLPASVSISHSAGRALAALLFTGGLEGAGCTVGADLELVAPRSDGFIRDFLTESERAELGSVPLNGRPARANGIWSAKEAVLKTLKLGLTDDTWKVECLLEQGALPDAPVPLRPAGEWRRFSARCHEEILPPWARGAEFLGFWREDSGYVLTVAAAVVRA
jgi:4'-phosphopantetheinyl transferase